MINIFPLPLSFAFPSVFTQYRTAIYFNLQSGRSSVMKIISYENEIDRKSLNLFVEIFTRTPLSKFCVEIKLFF